MNNPTIYKNIKGIINKITWTSPLGAKFTYEIHQRNPIHHGSYSMFVDDYDFDKHREEDDHFTDMVGEIIKGQPLFEKGN